MWTVNNKDIRMAEGDYGVDLPVTVSGATFTASDILKFTFKDKVNGTTVLEKEYTPTDNKVNLKFTEAESALFSVGAYVYSLDWYQNGVFMYNIIPSAILKVVDKA